MRAALPLALLLAACSSPAPEAPTRPAVGATTRPAAAATPPPATAPERLAEDAPRTTVTGNTFVAPAGWTLSVRGPSTVLTAPEGGSHVALVDVAAADADTAVAAALAAYDPAIRLPLKSRAAAPDLDGWTERHVFVYQTSPNARRDLTAEARRGGQGWTVIVQDLAWEVLEKRMSERGRIFGRLSPRGHERESFAGKPARALDREAVAELTGFVRRAQEITAVPGVAFGLVERGQVVFAGGLGVRELGRPAAVDADTRFMIASNTKQLTTLMLAKLVDAGKIGWDSPATSLLPSFALGDPDTTRQVQIRHLICACTGMPRQDLEWLFETTTPERAMATLATMQPTSGFGELYQYSNPMAAAAGFLGGHVQYPELALGPAYDKAMQTLVFDPLGMRATTFDAAEARRGPLAREHVRDLDGRQQPGLTQLNATVVPLRPTGGAWSTVNDLLRLVQMELAEGELPGGETYIGKSALLARRAPQVRFDIDEAYGMDLMTADDHGVQLLHHGGSLFGFYSDVLWLPEHQVGAVILTNGEPGWLIVSAFRRKLLELLFAGRPEAEARLAVETRQYLEELASERKSITLPADPAAAAALAPRYHNAALGGLAVTAGAQTRFDFGEFAGEVGSREHPDGTQSFVLALPGLIGAEFVVSPERTLILRDAQHEYTFTPVER
ncbi:CubicO group peptidase, beta-lactamase class C family [Nannocystis exedens]|uniref:CubicO group peptidase, beta-lactamase class C family n=1 Tax=Nannocystis exedens TaxID=54 RepID=A0A1I2FKL9_9BACT|nr:serine hydrolase domain-containing protein [Nannocystis exedens]PCC74450.1 serine hydrolase [Nannocystis exedens]SFF06012.1 CubicO group peptidase, beta-lactamase class C family [Nannocystis exedens]